MKISRYVFWLVLREAQKKRIIIYGDNKIGYSLEIKLKLCDVHISYFISDLPLSKSKVKDVYDLMYENREDIFVIITESDYEKCEKNLKEIGLREVMDYRRVDSLIDHYPIKWYLDVQLGHTFKLDECSYYGVRIFGHNSPDSFKIVTLGGSTTDAQLYPFESWSEILYQICVKKGHNVTIICAGVSSYTASQELVKLERDLLKMHPNMVISYSGVNDIYYEDNLKFASGYHRAVYEAAVSGKSRSLDCKGIFKGEQNECSAFEWWSICERMMYGICMAFNITFVGILQALLGGKIMNDREKEIFLNGSRNGKYPDIYRGDFEKQIIFREKIKELCEIYPFINDFSNLFDEMDVFNDECHVNEYGNRIIAEKVYSLIENELGEKTQG